MKYFHGTSSENLKSIQKNGFNDVSYFTTSMEDASYYAYTGGEWSLQDREEEYENKTGINLREEYESDLMDMFKLLYPKGHSPIVLVLDIPDEMINKARKDSGAENGLVFDSKIPSNLIVEVINIEFEDLLNNNNKKNKI